MTTATEMVDDRLNAGLTGLVALSDTRDGGRVDALIRRVCARTLSLPPLPTEIELIDAESDVESVVVDFAEQFSTDVSLVTADQRATLMARLGNAALRTVVLMYVADFVPRVRAGLVALGAGLAYLRWSEAAVAWDHESDPADAVFNRFLPDVARLLALDPVTSEIVRLRGAAQHNCRLCKSLRESTALDAGGTEPLYADIEHYETSALLTDRQRAALRYVDALIWSPAHIDPDVAAGVRRWFSDAEAVELTFDVMRNASNKIAVALGGDAPRVAQGTERYLLTPDGQTQFG